MLIKVAIVEDDMRLRNELSVLISESPGLNVIAAYPDAEMALKDIPKRLPEVVLMDINLPKMSGIECVSRLKLSHPEIKVLMLTVHSDSELIFKSLMAGAGGYLIKRSVAQNVVDAIREIMRGGAPMSSDIARKVVEFFQSKKESPAEEPLTQRQLEIVQQLALGLRDKEIADKLQISVTTVRSHIRDIYEKMHVRGRAEAVARYMQKRS